MPKRRTQTFLKEFVVLFGFLNGVWVAVGVNPGAKLFEVLVGLVENLASGVLVEFLFAFAPLVFLFVMLYLIFRKGGWLGFAAVVLAFVAGMQVVSAPLVSLTLLAGAFAAGYFATK